MAKLSAGILLYRIRDGALEVFLVHPGGPFWAKKDDGAWSIPKGEIEGKEDALGRARQEFREETGFAVAGDFHRLSEIKQAGGKRIQAFAVEGDCDAAAIQSNSFTLEWPPHSGRHREFPEVDRAAWFDLAQARRKINQAQTGFLDQLQQFLRG